MTGLVLWVLRRSLLILRWVWTDQAWNLEFFGFFFLFVFFILFVLFVFLGIDLG